MTTQDYLGQLRNIDYEIMAINTEAKSLRDIASNMHPNSDDILVDKSPNPGRMEDIIIKIVDTENKEDKRRETLINKKLRIEDQIKDLGDRFFYSLLWWSYHDNKRLYEIAHTLNYTPQHTKRLIRKAENAFEKKYGAEYLKKKS
jgi:hypothetical protein